MQATKVRRMMHPQIVRHTRLKDSEKRIKGARKIKARAEESRRLQAETEGVGWTAHG